MADVEIADLRLHSKSRELERRGNDDDTKCDRSKERYRDRSPHRSDRNHHREQEIRKRDVEEDDDDGEMKGRDIRRESDEVKYDRTKKRDRDRSPDRRHRTHRREQERRKWDENDDDDVKNKDRNRSPDADGEMQYDRPKKRDGEKSPHRGDKGHRREQEREKRVDDDVKKKDRNKSPDSDDETRHDRAKKRDRVRSPLQGDRGHRREQGRRKMDDDGADVKKKDRSRSPDSHEEMQYDQAKKKDWERSPHRRERSPHRRNRTCGREQERRKGVDDDDDNDVRKYINRILDSDEEMKHGRAKKRDRERSPPLGDKAHRRKPERQKRDGDDSNEDDVKKKDRNITPYSDEEMQYGRAKKSDRERSPYRGDKAHRREQERKNREKDVKEETKKEETVAVQQMPDAGMIKTGGIYIPPHRMAQMMREVQDKSSEQYQRLSWDALRKSINGLVNKVNATNIKNIIPELLSENLIRGRGLFCRSCMKSQMASPGFTDVFAALVAVVNTKFPEVGKLLLKRIVLQLRRAYKRNDKPQLLAATKFVAHLVNQQVAHEIIALELLTLLLEKPTDDSVEVAVGFVKECGALLQDFSPQGVHGIFERFRAILHEGEIDKRVQFLIEGLFAIRKAKFQGFPAIRPELDLVEQEDQFTHEVSLEDEIDPETSLDVFKPNAQFLEDEKAYEDLKKSILGDESSDNEEGSDAASDDEDDEESEEDEEENMEIKDETETNLVNLRRTIYLTIMSSVDFEEAGHKLLKIKLEPGQEMELCIMLLECCSQERTYLRYYGLLGQRFCMINKVHQENFEKCFVQQYSMIHRLETNKLRNVAKFFAHLLGTSALPWHVLAYIRLTEEDTTSSSRIFIKILFQELSEHLGIRLLNERLNDPTMQDSFESIFPKDNPKNTRFSINFFTSIGLGGITESLREYLKNMPRLIMQQQKPLSESDDDSENSASGSSSPETDSSSESEADSRSDESERRSRRRKRRKN